MCVCVCVWGGGGGGGGGGVRVCVSELQKIFDNEGPGKILYEGTQMTMVNNWL